MQETITPSSMPGLMQHDYSLLISSVGIIIGIVAIIIIMRALVNVGGQVGLAFKLALIGTAFQMIALFFNILSTITNTDTITLPLIGGIMSHNIHEGLMVIGILFFVLSAQQFSKLSR